MLQTDSFLNPRPAAEALGVSTRQVQNWCKSGQLPAQRVGNGCRIPATAIASAAEVDDAWRRRQRVEVIWTGPTPRGATLRRTDQALLELIRGARRQITLVSFVAYKVPDVAQALVDASKRGVAIRLIMETPETSEGAIAFRAFEALTGSTGEQYEWYTWPLGERPRDGQGRPGALHAKCGLADRDVAFVSSANLTEYALDLNMELGMLFKGGEVPEKLDSLLEGLIIERKLVRSRPVR